MRAFFALFPFNLIPIIIIFLHESGYLDIVDKYTFTVAVSAIILLTLSVEMIKAAMFALSSTVSWLDFLISFLLLVVLLIYIVYVYFKTGGVPSPLFWLALEAQALDVIVGFYITLTNARRDIGAERLD
ncbi:MAG: hypothetical protein GXO61_04760 [Epsilonproteobacteria bacterium]|nr:hypothetical protein [Campylobacterota bacterium]